YMSFLRDSSSNIILASMKDISVTLHLGDLFFSSASTNVFGLHPLSITRLRVDLPHKLWTSFFHALAINIRVLIDALNEPCSCNTLIVFLQFLQIRDVPISIFDIWRDERLYIVYRPRQRLQ